MEYALLGPLEVLRDGHPVTPGPAKLRAVLAVLLLHANEVVSVERLADELWGGSPPPTATKTVRLYVSQLRRALGEDGEAIVTRPPGYVLLAEPDQIDVVRFRRMAEEARARMREGDAERADAILARALALWRGPALAGLALESLAGHEAQRLEDERVAAQMDRIDCALALGRSEQAIGELEGLVARLPLLERAREQLMLALYRAGRQAEALAAFQDARRTLVGELGLEPGRPLRELHAAILRQDPSLDPPARPAAQAVDAGRSAFVGRDDELAQLRAGLESATAGNGRLFLLVGEPGIGKSRLAEELIRHARGRGVEVLIGRCWEAGGAPAYWPWVQSLRALVERTPTDLLLERLGAGAADVAQIVPALRERLDLPEPALADEGARLRAFDAAAGFLRRSAAERPLLVALDDLHAADEPSLLFLRFLAGELDRSRILVVGTYRDVDPTVADPLALTLAELARRPVTRRIDLGGLDAGDVRRFIELTTGDAAPPELAQRIHAETEGNPLFVGEVVRLLDAEGRLGDGGAGGLWTTGLPQGVREVIGRRLRRLSARCGRVLTLAAVMGREFGLRALAAVSGASLDELLGALDEAVAVRLVAAVPGAPGRMRFAHALIRETIYEELSPLRRVQLHGLVGEALERLYGDDPDPHLAELAHHFAAAAAGGHAGRAVAYARRGGDRARRLLAYEEAARLYGVALDALELGDPGDPALRCELLLSRGDALARAGRTPEARETFLAAADVARGAGLVEHLGRAALGYGGRFPWLRAGLDTDLVPLLREALDAQGGADTALRARLLARLAGALRDEPSLEPRSSLSREAVAIARRLGDRETLGYALVSLATATWSPEIEELIPVAEEVTRLAEETGDRERAFEARWLLHVAAMTIGDTAWIARVGEEHRAIAEQLREPSQLWYSVVMRSHLALFHGRFDEAEALAEEALALGRQAQGWDAGFSYRIVLFVLRREQGRLAEIEDLVRRSVAEYPGYRSFPCLVALLDCELGRDDAARRALARLSADGFAALPRDGEWVFCMCVLTEVAVHLADRERMAALYELLAPYEDRNALATAEVCLGSAARYLGLLAHGLGRFDEAERHFEAALAMNARMGPAPSLAHTRHDYARMLRARGRPADEARAAGLLEQALAAYRELGIAGPTGPAVAAPPSATPGTS